MLHARHRVAERGAALARRGQRALRPRDPRHAHARDGRRSSSRAASARATARCRWCCSARSAGARPATPRRCSTPISPSRSASRSCSTRWSACSPTTPAAEGDARAPPAKPQLDPQMAARHPLRILLAEDNVVNQKLAMRLLQQMGYRADLASNGIEAVESVQRQTYDVVLMDVQMPEMDGLDATRQICALMEPARAPAHRRDDRQRDAGRPRDVPRRRHGRLPDQADPRRAPGRGAERGSVRAGAADMSGPPVDRRRPSPSCRTSAGADFVRELVDTFLEEAPRMLDELRERWPRRRRRAFRRAAHSLKSNANTFGALGARRLARELELGGPRRRRPAMRSRDARRGVRARRRGACGSCAVTDVRHGPARACSSPTTTRSTACCSRAASSCRATASPARQNGRVALEMLRARQLRPDAARHGDAGDGRLPGARAAHRRPRSCATCR